PGRRGDWPVVVPPAANGVDRRGWANGSPGAGGLAMLEERLNPVHWTWMLYLEMFLAGVAGGAFVAAAILELSGRGRSAAARTAHLIPFPLLALSTILLIVDLYRPERFWHMALMSERGLPILKPWSPMSLGT